MPHLLSLEPELWDSKGLILGKLPEGVSWQYASGKTIHQISDGRYGWFYQDDNVDWWFTEGMPSRPFMYLTANELRQIVTQTAKEVFG